MGEACVWLVHCLLRRQPKEHRKRYTDPHAASEWDHPSGDSLPLYRYFAEIVDIFDRGPHNQFANYDVAGWPVARRVRWIYNP